MFNIQAKRFDQTYCAYVVNSAIGGKARESSWPLGSVYLVIP